MLRTLVALALAVSAAFAQFEDTDSGIEECRKNCCVSYGGSWEGGACSVLPDGEYNDYLSCDNSCLEQALEETRQSGGETSLCCAPAFLVFGILGLAFWGERRAARQQREWR